MRTATRWALERLVLLDRSVRAGECPNAATFARRIEVDPRTVQRDFESLRDRFGAPLAYDRRKNGYVYTDPDFRLSFLELSDDELIALFLAGGVLRQYRGTPYADDLARACRKIAVGLSDRLADGFAASHSFRITAPASHDPAVLRVLENAIRDRARLTIRYYSASSDAEADREVDPFHLANVDGQFYLVAYCHRRRDVRTFAPGRIRSVAATGATFDPPHDFAIDSYLARSFGVLRGDVGEEHHVRLRFTGEAVRYVRERDWHASQVVEEEGPGFLTLSWRVSHLREVERFALSWGGDCEVIGPESLRERVQVALGEASARYLPRSGHTVVR